MTSDWSELATLTLAQSAGPTMESAPQTITGLLLLIGLCGLVGAAIGRAFRNRPDAGFILGGLSAFAGTQAFGLLVGVLCGIAGAAIVLAFSDERPKCPTCRGVVEHRAATCKHCHAQLPDSGPEPKVALLPRVIGLVLGIAAVPVVGLIAMSVGGGSANVILVILGAIAVVLVGLLLRSPARKNLSSAQPADVAPTPTASTTAAPMPLPATPPSGTLPLPPAARCHRCGSSPVAYNLDGKFYCTTCGNDPSTFTTE